METFGAVQTDTVRHGTPQDWLEMVSLWKQVVSHSGMLTPIIKWCIHLVVIIAVVTSPWNTFMACRE